MIGNKQKTLALIGAGGMLAKMVMRVVPGDYRIIPLDLPEFDLTEREQVLAVLVATRPEVILNCAAFTNVDLCESREEQATQVNGRGPGYLAEAARETGSVLLHVSTDYVFDGAGTRPYREEDPVAPSSAYGRSKLAGEKAILDSGQEKYFIVRTSWLYGPNGKNFVETIARLAQEREELRVVADQIGSPTYTLDLARAIFHLLAIPKGGGPSVAPFGIYHFANEGVCSWYDFAVAILDQLRESGVKVRCQKILPVRTEEYPLPARRPAYSVLSKEKYKRTIGMAVPGWRDALERYFKSRKA